MQQYTLSDSELANFSDDLVRAEIRSRVATMYPEEETIIIADVEGNEWDRVSGDASSFSEPLPEFTPEEQAERLEAEAKTLEEARRLEEVIRPIVMKKLRLEARAEIREQVREGANAVLELAALKATLKKADSTTNNRQKVVDTRNRAEVLRMQGKIDTLTLENETLKGELKASKEVAEALQSKIVERANDR